MDKKDEDDRMHSDSVRSDMIRSAVAQRSRLEPISLKTAMSPLPSSLPHAALLGYGELPMSDATAFVAQFTRSAVKKSTDEDVFARRIEGKSILLCNPMPSSSSLSSSLSESLETQTPGGKTTETEPRTESKKKKEKEKEKEKKERRKARKQPIRKHAMSAQEQRRLRAFSVPASVRFADVLPLHHLWQQYMKEVLRGTSPATSASQLLPKLIKADYHGAILTVVQSKCPSHVGISGILIKETENIFYLATRENKCKAIPKVNTIVTAQAGELCITLYGSHIRCRSSERSSKKFKPKPTVALF